MDTENNNLKIIRSYLAALESGQVGEDLAHLFVEDAMQVEFPNKLNPNGQKSDLNSILERSVQGQKLLLAQSYKINTEIAQRNRVAVEANWTGTLAIPFGTLEAGSKLRASFAMFFEFKNGLIFKQHNYDCFEEW